MNTNDVKEVVTVDSELEAAMLLGQFPSRLIEDYQYGLNRRKYHNEMGMLMPTYVHGVKTEVNFRKFRIEVNETGAAETARKYDLIPGHWYVVRVRNGKKS